MIKELLFGVIFIFAPSIIYVGKKLSVDVACQDSSDKNCITEPTARYPTMVHYPEPEVKTGSSKTAESTWTYTNNSYLFGYPKSVSNQRLTYVYFGVIF